MEKERIPTRIRQFPFCFRTLVGFKAGESDRSSLAAKLFNRGAANSSGPSSYNGNLPRKSI
jgi:hypothetical protein